MKTIQLDLYGFDELDEKAQQKALEQFRDINLLFDWWEFQFDDFIALCGYLGITVDKGSIVFQGFYFQDNGSGFSADVDLKALAEAIVNENWKQYAPKLELNLTMPAIDRRVLRLAINGQLELTPRIIGRHRTYGVVADFGGYPTGNYKRVYDNICGEIDGLEKWLETIATALNRILFKSLETAFEDLSSDTAITDTILANNYQFTADGKFASRLEQLANPNN